ncbi:hypothetical protein DRO48_01155 [Candidatus Bathyarchaeota archaeon]|nr:MAG: hypothetical protein DRO48_01155 [Candidatus Bathyarchaeota archaeon]
MGKNGFRLSTLDVVLMGLGAAMYAVFAAVTYFIPIAGMSLRPAIAIVTFFGAAFGPHVGFVAGAIGNLLCDFTWGEFWWEWDVGVGIIGLISGLWWLKNKGNYEKGIDYAMAAILSVIGSFVGCFFAGFVDVAMGVPFEVAIYAWAFPGAASDAIFGLILTPALLKAYQAFKLR